MHQFMMKYRDLYSFHRDTICQREFLFLFEEDNSRKPEEEKYLMQFSLVSQIFIFYIYRFYFIN